MNEENQQNQKNIRTLSKDIDPRQIGKILVIARGGFSDMMMTIPYVRALHHHYQQAHISILAAKEQSEVFTNCPYIDTIIPDIVRNHSSGSATPLATKIIHLIKLASKLHGKFDLVTGPCFEGTTANLLAFMVGARYRVGFDLGMGFLLTSNLGPLDHELTSNERNNQLLAAMGIEKTDPMLEIYPSTDDMEYVNTFLHRHGAARGELLIGLHPGSDWACQQWPIDNWARLGDELTNRYQAKLIITGTQAENEMAEQISGLMETKPINAVGRTSLGQLAALISKYTAVVAVDSVAPSISLARGVPVVLLCRSAHTQWQRAPWPALTVLYNDTLGWPTWSAECRWSKQRETTRCTHPDHIGIDGMGLISVQEVLQSVDKRLSSLSGVHNDNKE